MLLMTRQCRSMRGAAVRCVLFGAKPSCQAASHSCRRGKRRGTRSPYVGRFGGGDASEIGLVGLT